jgi:hypothetical protein
LPYVEQKRRDPLDTFHMPHTAGELNYCISKLLLDYTQRKGLSYGIINEVMGVLSCAGQEYYRRVAAPYENEKRILNGDLDGFRNLTEKKV